MSTEPLSITRAGWYQLAPPSPKPETWDLCVGNGQHLGWDRCWAFVLTNALASRELSIVWAIGYAMKAACEEVAIEEARVAYEQGWRDACDDFMQQAKDPMWAIGNRKQLPYEPAPNLTPKETP